jgi:sugar lactone lactonase YvrE
VAYITDSSAEGSNAIIVVDLATGKARRRLNDHPSTEPDPKVVPLVEGKPVLEQAPTGKPRPVKFGADGIAISAGGNRLYYRPISSRRLYSVSTDALLDPAMGDAQVAATVIDHGRTVITDGMESDAQGRLYLTDVENNAVRRLTPSRRAGGDRSARGEVLVSDPRLLWPDTLSLGADGYLYVTSNQLHRQPQFNNGRDLRQKPYSLFRIPVDGKPVTLRR